MRPANLDELDFKFKIGDVLLHKGAAHILPPKPRPPRKPDHKGVMEALEEEVRDWSEVAARVTTNNCFRLVVVERIAQECPGGVQLKYHCCQVCGRDGQVANGQYEFVEEELIPLPE